MKIYASADPIRIVQSLGKIFRHLIIDDRVNESALLACLFAAAQRRQVVFQCHFLPDGVSRTIACLLRFLFVIRSRCVALGRKCLGVERCNGVFPINAGVQNCAVRQFHRVFGRCCCRCRTAATFGHRHCVFVFAVDVFIGVGGCEILLIGIRFHACAVCDILVSADTGQRHILQSDLCLGSAAVRSCGVKAPEVIVHPANANHIRQVVVCHFRCRCLVCSDGRVIFIGLPGHLYAVLIRLECNVFILCKPWVCTRLCNGIEHFHSAELVCSCVGFRQFKASVEHIAAVLGTLFQEGNVYGIGVAVVSGLVVQVADRQHSTLAVVILLGIVYLVGKLYRRNRLIGQFILHVCIILGLFVCISLGITIVIRISGIVFYSLVPTIILPVCIRRIIRTICRIINRILRIAVLGCGMDLEIRRADSHIIIAAAVFCQLCGHTQVNRFTRLDLVIGFCALAQFSHQPLVCGFFRVCIRLGKQCVLDTLCRLDRCAAV